jgi:inorganic triphosphatase YgiF
MNEEMQDHQELEWQFDAMDVRPVSRWLSQNSSGRNPSVATGETSEISEPLDGADPETLTDATGPVGVRVRALTGPEALRPLFEVKTRRSTHDLMLDGRRAGEIALDETAIPLDEEAEPARLRRVEVEVELDAFDRLEPFVERLRQECRLSPAVAS